MLEEAMYYDKLDGKAVRCLLCPWRCRLAPGEVGACLGRSNHAGVMVADNYGQSANRPALDPIEKKPLYHFRPGSDILSLGPNACNLHCNFCQNWTLSQVKSPTMEIAVATLVQEARACGAVAFTYTEPLMWYEFLLDAGAALKEAGVKVCLVSNATISVEPLKRLLPLVDAVNYDLKSFDPRFYKEQCRGFLQTVLETIEVTAQKAHVEITFLMIPGLNDDSELFAEMCLWIKEKCGAETPLHISRYFPNFKTRNPPTPPAKLEEFFQLARRYLSFVYLGNTSGHSDTHCQSCGELLVARSGYRVRLAGLKGNLCGGCGAGNNFVF